MFRDVAVIGRVIPFDRKQTKREDRDLTLPMLLANRILSAFSVAKVARRPISREKSMSLSVFVHRERSINPLGSSVRRISFRENYRVYLYYGEIRFVTFRNIPFFR